VHTERPGTESTLSFVIGAIYIIAGLVGVLYIEKSNSYYTFSSFISLFSAIAGPYFVLNAWRIKKCRVKGDIKSL
jgi:NADH:ubiquinone oxidoreductase subunit 6 (subunit J)